jgi:hypothetical protein
MFTSRISSFVCSVVQMLPAVLVATLLVGVSGCGGKDEDPANTTASGADPTKSVVQPNDSATNDNDLAQADTKNPTDDGSFTKPENSGETTKDSEPKTPEKDAPGGKTGDETTDKTDTNPSDAKPVDPKKAKRQVERKKWAEVATNISKMRTIAIAFHNYHETFRSFLPDPKQNKDYFDKDGKLKVSWRVHLLPYLVDDFALYEKFNLDEAWDSPNNKPLLEQMPDIYRTDGDKGNKTRIVGFTDTNKENQDRLSSGFPVGRSVRIRDILDGTSNTILFVKAPKAKAVDWTAPEDFLFDSTKIEETAKSIATEKDGILIAFMDGSVHLLKSTMLPETLANLINPQDGKNVRYDKLTLRRPSPMDFVDPKSGPVHLAYMHPRAVAAIVLHPKAIFETPLIKKLASADIVKQIFAGAPFDPRKIEEVVIWVTPDNMYQPAYFSIRASDEATIDAIQKDPPPNMPGLKHDTLTMVYAPETILQEILDGDLENKPLADLLGKEMPKDHALAVVSLDHPFLKQFANPQMLAQLRLPPNLADERVLGIVGKLQSIRLSLDLDGDVLQKTAFKMADAESAEILKTFLTNGLEMAKSQLSELPAENTEVALAKSVSDGLKVVAKADTVTLQLNPNKDVREKLAEAVEKAMLAANKAAEGAARKNNLKMIGLGFHNYHDVYGRFAPADNKEWLDKDGKPYLSWRVHILPYMDHVELYQKFKLDEPWDSDNNKPLLAEMPDIFATEGVEKAGHTSLLTFTGKDTPFNGKTGPRMASVTDGTSNTLLVVHAGADKAVPWTKPTDLTVDLEKPFESLGKIGDAFEALMMDGSVRNLSDAMPVKTLKSLITPAGGEIIDDF